MPILLILSGVYLAALLESLWAGCAGSHERVIVRRDCPEGYWVLLLTYGFGGCLCFALALVA